MNRLRQITGIGLLLACTGLAAADKGYKDSNGRWGDYYDDAPGYSEVFYVEGRVISATPIYESHWYYRSRGDDRRGNYREVCRIRDVEVYRSSRSTNAGPAGAIIGGAIGAHVGSNAGRNSESAVIGAIAGSVIGGVIGSEIERDGGTTIHYQVERDCDIRYHHEERVLIGYEVRYRYNGREFTIETHEHPGRYIQLRVEVMPSLR